MTKLNLEGSKEADRAIKSSYLVYDTKVAIRKKLLSPPTAKDAKKMVPTTNELLLYLSSLNIVMFDIEEEYKQVGWYRQTTKKALNLASKKVREIFDDVYNTTARTETEKRGTTSYNAAMMDAYNVVGESVLLTPPERSYNIAMALIRIILRLNDTLGNYEVVGVQRLRNVEKTLSELPNKPTQYQLDNIITTAFKQYL